MRTVRVMLTVTLLASCTPTHEFSEGPWTLGGGVRHTEIAARFYYIVAITDRAPWTNYPGAQRAWRRVADDLCGKGRYQELSVEVTAKKTGVPAMGLVPSIGTQQRGYALCSDARVTYAEANALVMSIESGAAEPASISSIARSGGEPVFMGHTVADATVQRDALAIIRMLIQAKIKCSTLDLIESEGLAADAHPNVSLPSGAGPATYERWIVTACSRKQPFVVVFWPAKEGGTMFRVQPEAADS
jgi:hypothetical protein